VATETQNRLPEIQWRDIIGTRNRLIHAYEAVNLDILWEIATADFPSLITQLQRTIEQEQPREALPKTDVPDWCFSAASRNGN
jgi:uncharacterized protein with HEPN domain